MSNIINKAKQFRAFVERLLFNEETIPFEIDREPIKFLHIKYAKHNRLLKNHTNLVNFYGLIY